jgi:hypothetical protein
MHAALQEKRLRQNLDAFQRANKSCFNCGSVVRSLGDDVSPGQLVPAMALPMAGMPVLDA